MSHIFISYSRKDIDFAGKIVEALAKNKLDTWIDWKSIPKGEKWVEEIYRGIEEADVFLFLISPDSIQSEMCNKEIAHSVKNGKRIIPIVIRDADSKSIPAAISERNWIFCREGEGNFDTAIRETYETIHTDYEWLKYHTKLQVKALDWKRKKDDSRLLRGRELQEAEQQLASVGSKKDPQPTDLQRQFISVSRKAEQRRQKTITTIGVGVSTIICLLFIIAIVGGTIAYVQNKAAASAQIQVTEQKNIADTRQLANIANNLSLEQGDTAILSGLLAVEAAKRYPELESDQALRNFLSIAALPISEMKFDDFIVSVDFSPNREWVAAASFDGTTRVWDEISGQEIIQLKTDSSFVKFSPDGKWLVTIDCENREEENIFGGRACLNNAAGIWDTNSWQKVSKMTNGNYVHSVAFSSDSHWVVSGGENRSIVVWEAATGKEFLPMIQTNKESFGVYSVGFSPDGNLVVSGGTSDFTAIVWDVDTGRKIAQMVHDGEVHFTSFSPNNKWVISGGYSDNVIVWDAYTGEEISRLVLDSYAYNGFFSPDGKLVAIQGNGFIVIWNPQTEQIVSRILGEVISFSPDSKQIYTGGTLAKVWDVITGTEIRRMVFVGNALAFNIDGTRVAFANHDGTVYIREFPADQEVSLMNHEGSVESIAFSPNNQWIVSGSQDGTTRVWDVFTGKEISRVTVDGLVVDVDFSSDGKWIAQGACEGVSEGIVACGKPIIRIWEAKTGKEIYKLKPGFAIGAIKFAPDNKRIIIVGQHGSLELWDLSSETILTKFSPYIEFNDGDPYPGSFADFIYAVDVDPKGRWITAGVYTSTQVWELDSGREVYKSTTDGKISSIVFSPSGNWIASTNNASIRIWNPENGNELLNIPLEPFTGASSLTFSPDEKWIIGKDQTSIHVWEISTGREISRITKNLINSVDFSPDGKWIASGSNDNTVRIWLWRPEDLIVEACSRLPRNLTQEEWKQYIGEEPYKPTCANLPIPTE